MRVHLLRIATCFLICVALSSCATSPDQEEAAPLRSPVGIVRSVHLAERYLVFEAEYKIPEGTRMLLLRDGVPAGTLRAGASRRRKFQSADIVEGRPSLGDLVEPQLRVQPQQTQQGQSSSLGPQNPRP